MNRHGSWSPKLSKRRSDATRTDLKKMQIMDKIIPLDQQDREHCKQQNAEVLEKEKDGK